MKRYVALLRGINVSGKNKISMQELKAGFVKLGYGNVQTYLNSGNVVFTAAEEINPADKIRDMIQSEFLLEIPVFVILQNDLQALLRQAPGWWGTERKERYDNLIFVLPPATAGRIAEQIGEPTGGLEQIELCGNAVFWSFDRKQYAKANWWKKTAARGIGEMLTIRTANTVKKIAEL